MAKAMQYIILAALGAFTSVALGLHIDMWRYWALIGIVIAYGIACVESK